ncbi:CorA family divalent cation transporter, partial [Escherichia coli]|uniref:CorA family divalent cation transporter n=1 Tax=Escherichia coli TaxID=562 RepID=UPI000BD774DD
ASVYGMNFRFMPELEWEFGYVYVIALMVLSAVGFININQNKIIKIFSVASVALLPPTLIASVYGMNFRFMPELEWEFGYVYVIALMVLSAVG